MDLLVTSSRSKIISEVHELFKRYGPAFVDLVDGTRSELNILLNFYSAPLRFIGSTFHMVMKDNDAITSEDGIGGEIGRLRHAHLAASSLDKCDVKVLNAQAALVDAVWLRRDSAGALLARFRVIYLVTVTPDGWRITSAVDTSD